MDAGEDVVITYYQTWREPSFIKDEYGKRVIVEKADASQPGVIEELAKKHKTEHIVHLAVPGVMALGPYEDYRVNMNGLIGVLEAARNAEVKRLSLASSIAVYHSLPAGPYRETDRLPVESANPTETFKKSWEILAFHYAGRTGLDVVSMRIGGIWGPLYHFHDEPPQQARPRRRQRHRAGLLPQRRAVRRGHRRCLLREGLRTGHQARPAHGGPAEPHLQRQFRRRHLQPAPRGRREGRQAGRQPPPAGRQGPGLQGAATTWT